MDTNEFLSRLKADGSERDVVSFDDVLTEYLEMAGRLGEAEASCLALNVLCMMCRNLDKVAGWRERSDAVSLLRLCVAAAGHVKSPSLPERTRALAALYHLHKHATKQKVSHELVLKLSAHVFKDEPKDLLKEYCKTYWAVLADKICYIEKLKLAKLNVKKLIPSLTCDVVKTIIAYNTAHFCAENLAVIIKMLYHIFSEIASIALDAMFGKIFEELLAKNDTEECAQTFKDAAIIELFTKVSECFGVVVENASKCHFDSCALSVCVRFALKLFAHRTDINHCLDVFYVKGFCDILTKQSDYVDVLNGLRVSIETAGELGYELVANETYPYLNQIVRTHLERSVLDFDRNKWLSLFSVDAQCAYLAFIISLMRKLARSRQILKCDNCALKSGLHDTLRLSFSVRHFITNSLKYEMDISRTLPLICEAIEEQMSVMNGLKGKCANAEKCRFKVQTDMHNNAILLYKSRYYEYSNRLFDIYIRGEISMYAKADYSEKSYLSRAFYNKAICELDMLDFESALRSSFVSLALTDVDGLGGDKHMSFVIDVKSKALAGIAGEEGGEGLQAMTVLNACLQACDSNEFGDLRPLLRTVEFSALLEHEFSRYGRLWPSLAPVAGVWASFDQLLEREQPSWMLAEERESVLLAACRVALATPCVARTVHHPRLGHYLRQLTERLRRSSSKSLQFAVAWATCLLLEAELDIAEAKTKYGWRSSARSAEPAGGECPVVGQTLRQEYDALKRATEAVDVWTDILPRLDHVVPPGDLRTALADALRVAAIFVAQLLHYERTTHALQLAHVCVEVAARVGDRVLYARNLGVLLVESLAPCVELDRHVDSMNRRLQEMLEGDGTREDALCYMCDAAVYLRRSSVSLAASMLRYVQLALLSAAGAGTTESLDRACGRLLEAQRAVARGGSGPCVLTGLNTAHRHYLAAKIAGGAAWAERRARASHVTRAVALTGERCVAGAARLLLCRRARASAAPALRLAAAGRQARVHAALAVTTTGGSDVQIKIDTIKSILEIKPTRICVKSTTDENVTVPATDDLKVIMNAKSDTIEAFLDATVFKKTQNGPASPYFDVAVAAFSMPDFLLHIKFCDCFACQNPWCAVIALQMYGIEASMHFRNGDVAIAKNYYCGVLRMFDFVEVKIGHFFEEFNKKMYEKYVLKMSEAAFAEELNRIKGQILIEYAFFETSEGNLEYAEKLTVDIFNMIESMQEDDPYLRNEAWNVVCMLEFIKNNVKAKIDQVGLEKEFDGLKLSPPPSVAIVNAKTPEVKVVPPKLIKEKIVLKQDDLPHVKRKVIKLNLDERSPSDSEDCETDKLVGDKMLTDMSKLKISETESKQFEEVFSTPMSKPIAKEDQFFTPMTSIKTYAKKSLRHQIVKNLEAEFKTPTPQPAKVLPPTETPTVFERSRRVKRHDTESSSESDIENRLKKGPLIEKAPKKVNRGAKSSVESEVEKKPKKVAPEFAGVSEKAMTQRVNADSARLMLTDRRRLKRATSPGKLSTEDVDISRTSSRPVRGTRTQQLKKK